MIIVLEYDTQHDATLWTAENKDMFINAVATTHNATPEACRTYSQALRMNRDNCHEQIVFEGVEYAQHAIRAYDDATPNHLTRKAYEKLKELLQSEPKDERLIKLEKMLNADPSWSKLQVQSLMNILKVVINNET